jgi:murein endopeptidase
VCRGKPRGQRRGQGGPDRGRPRELATCPGRPRGRGRRHRIVFCGHRSAARKFGGASRARLAARCLDGACGALRHAAWRDARARRARQGLQRRDAHARQQPEDDARARRDRNRRPELHAAHARADAAAELATDDRPAKRSRGKNAPWDGTLQGAERLPGDEGYRIRRPSRSYGVPYVIDHLRNAIAVVRALYPDVHTLAIGDLSAEHGGKLDNHRSHQTGLDVDVGFFYRTLPEGYPDRFALAGENLDLEATWALVTAFSRTSALDDGVEIIFLDHAVQKRLYDWAHRRGTPDEDLAQLLQYPRSKDTQVGLVRHWPNHADHLHVRFKSTGR